MKANNVIWWDIPNGDYLFHDNKSLANSFASEYSTWLRCDVYKDHKSKIILEQHIAKLNEKGYIGDILENIFRDHTSLKYTFAKQLNLYEMLSAECFTPIDAIGRAAINLLSSAQINFIVYRKHYFKMKKLEIDFVVFHIDNVIRCYEDVVKHKIIS